MRCFYSRWIRFLSSLWKRPQLLLYPCVCKFIFRTLTIIVYWCSFKNRVSDFTLHMIKPLQNLSIKLFWNARPKSPSLLGVQWRCIKEVQGFNSTMFLDIGFRKCASKFIKAKNFSLYIPNLFSHTKLLWNSKISYLPFYNMYCIHV